MGYVQVLWRPFFFDVVHNLCANIGTAMTDTKEVHYGMHGNGTAALIVVAVIVAL